MKKLLTSAIIALAVLAPLSSAPAKADTPFIGQIMTVGFNFCPLGWTMADGSTLSSTSYQSLYSLLGTTFGGDGVQSFSLPDLRGRSVVGEGNAPGLDVIRWGQSNGRTSVTLTTAEMPSHNHFAALMASGAVADSLSPSGAGLASALVYATGSNPDQSMMDGSVTLMNAGGGESLDISNPFLGMYNCIAFEGIYPSRN